MYIQLSQHHWLKRLFFPYWIGFDSLVEKSIDHKYKNLFLYFQFYPIDLQVYSVLVHFLDHCSFVVSYQLWKFESFNIFHFHSCLGYSVSFALLVSWGGCNKEIILGDLNNRNLFSHNLEAKSLRSRG